jgi:hypothetical protein
VGTIIYLLGPGAAGQQRQFRCQCCGGRRLAANHHRPGAPLTGYSPVGANAFDKTISWQQNIDQ